MMPHDDFPRLAILGAGPIGLEAALQAAALKMPFTVYERGRVGEHLQRWGHVRLFTPFAMNSTSLGRARLLAEHPHQTMPADNALLTGREHFVAYLEPLAQSPLLREHIRGETTVLYVGRCGLLKEELAGDSGRGQRPFLLLLRHGNRESIEEADVVLDCTGTYGQPRSLGDGGIPAIGETAARPHIAWGLEDVLGERRAVYADKTTMVVGSGYSAATSVCLLSKLAEKHPATWIIWLGRGGGSQPIKRFVNDALRERDRVAVRANTLATRGEGNVEFHPQSVVTTIDCAGADKGFKIHAVCAGKPMVWEVDRLIANVGYIPNSDLYRELHVPECLTPPAQGGAALPNSEPNFFVLGAKSYGRNSNFLLQAGFEQVREMFAFITNNAELLSRFSALRQLSKIAR